MAKRNPEDPKARAVLEMLAGVGPCPDCGTIAEWGTYQGHKSARCPSQIKYCNVVYYRPDGYCIRVGDQCIDPISGNWTWTK